MKKIKKLLSLVLLTFIGQAMQAGAETNYLSISPFYIEPGEIIEIELDLTNNENICAFQTDLLLPEGLSVSEDEDGFLDVYVSSARAKRHTLESSINKDGSVLILCYSNKNTNFTAPNI